MTFLTKFTLVKESVGMRPLTVGTVSHAYVKIKLEPQH